MSYEWTNVRAPKAAQLNAVESAGSIAFAAGARGLMMERSGTGEWRTLFETGPRGNGSNLLGCGMTTDDRRIWFTGAGGTFGYYDRRSEEVENYATPYDLTDDLTSVSVSGPAGNETLHVTTDSGRVFRASMDQNDLTVDGVAVPRDGATINEVVRIEQDHYLADDAGYLHYSQNGKRWRSHRLAETSVVGVATAANGLCAVTDSHGVHVDISVFGEEGRRKQFPPGISAPNDVSAGGRTFVVCGDSGGVSTMSNKDAPFTPQETGKDKSYRAVELMSDGTIIAVGAEGTISEGRFQ
ncbi:hypothetical protein JCM30237_04940 [Halolamina litorea]|uniref:Uncharacterized protein n=1 Tax=Halolamina litorea TaxID=1515593 RepID=A0ABD6BPC0_9EURY|nr:hypothetical protein [Halolamina litorea]